ncbi:hypothetical protein NM680_10805 [Paracoccus sp. PS-1]|uniref:hypothetical protein n=1 Tax=Paracoccus sp. PS1 TaxID=2963938 RepID=UPI0027E56F0F|nr:hypothetical protein [Paracoccus sp. PS1]MDQ7262283.1 hypothetical protein [Paracoccus sp. PS1]
MAILSFNPNRAIDLSGFTVPGALATFYDSGTSQERIVYSDPDCTLPHPSPLAADGAGVFPAVYDTGNGDVKVEVRTPDGVMLAGYPMDPAVIVDSDQIGAAAIQFDPTDDIPETNVQEAIERVQANMIQPLLDYGLGVTGNAPLLANIDGTGIASGTYRFGIETAGTFPPGITAGLGGIVRVWRENSGSAIMILVDPPGRRHWVRSFGSGSWNVWAYMMQSTDTADNAIWAAGSSTTPYTATPAGVRAGVAALAIGMGQTWTAVGRNVGQSYQNTTGRPIMVSIDYEGGNDDRVQVSANGSSWVTLSWRDSVVNFVVPPGHYYRLTSGQLAYWVELR